jgi:hypothetical protein
LLQRVWGTISILLGAVAMAPLTFLIVIRQRPIQFGHVVYLLAVIITCEIPGAMYWWFSIYQQRRRRWAITAGLIASSFHFVCALAGAVFLLAIVRMPAGRSMIVPLICGMIFAAGCLQMIYYLARSYAPLAAAENEARGFNLLKASA